MKFCLNVEELFPELDFYDKFAAAKMAGYEYVEFWGWDGRDLEKIKKKCKENDVKITAIKGELNWSLCDNESSEGFIDWIKKSLDAAKFLECESIIVHSNHLGAIGAADFSKYSNSRMIANITSNLMRVAPILEKANINLMIEPLSQLGSLKKTFLTSSEVTADIVRAVGSRNVKIVYDVFQMQITEGNLTNHMLNILDIMNYIHIADAPGRGEPGTGELNYSFILNTLKENGFDGVACFELTPTGTTEDVLKATDSLISTVK